MAGEADAVPRKRRPYVVGSGLLVFVCIFLPTLRVCGDPTAPVEFPPSYVVYVGSALVAYFGMSPGLRRARIAIAAWFLMWGLGLVAVLAIITADDAGELLAVAVAVLGFAGVASLVRFVHKKQLADRGMFAVGVAQGLIVTGWYLSLAGDKDHMWGAYVGLAAGFVHTVACAIALSSAQSARREVRDDAFPVARVVLDRQ